MVEKLETVDSSAAVGFAKLHNSEAEFFDKLGTMAARLRELKQIQSDKLGRLDRMKIKMTTEDPAQLEWTVEALGGMKLRELAFRQLCNRIGFPPQTLTKCPMPLAIGNLNYFMAMHGSKGHRFRLEGNEVRAIVTDVYEPVSHLEIIERLQQSGVNLKVDGDGFAGFSDSAMYALCLDPDSKFDGPDGSILSHATVVANSETGQMSYSASDLWYDHICCNRNIWGVKVRGGRFKRAHKGKVREGLDELTRWLQIGRKADTMEWAKTALNKAAKDIIHSEEGPILDYLKTKAGIGPRVGVQVIKSARKRWPDKDGLSRWSLMSGATEVAQTLGLDARVELEEKASVLMS
jgi:hypothetical protein